MARRMIRAQRSSPYLLYLVIAFAILTVGGWVFGAWMYSKQHQTLVYVFGEQTVQNTPDLTVLWRDTLDKYRDDGNTLIKVIENKQARADAYRNEIQRLIQAATAKAEELCWRQLITATWVAKCDRWPATELWLPKPPLQSVNSIQYVDAAGDTQTLDTSVYDVDAEHAKLVNAGLQTAMPLEDHPWGDRGFSVIDPIGNSVYIYSDREPAAEFKQYHKD